MGEAKRRQQGSALPPDFYRDAFARAMRKMFEAASEALNTDCLLHAMIAREALSQLGVPSELCVGYAAWRVDGASNHGVIAHHPQGSVMKISRPDSPAVMYHAWLKIGTDIVDFTTYQLPAKAAAMDALDGHRTPVNWAPPYLWVPTKSGKSYADVRDSYTAGVYHYQRDTALEARVKREGADRVDDEDVNTLLAIYRMELSGPVVVIGPNDLNRNSP